MLWREKALILHVEDANLDYRDSTWLVNYLGGLMEMEPGVGETCTVIF
jgi:hypothetical protein